MTDPNKLDILARPGANDQVINKKVLLAVLACAEADRLNFVPDDHFLAMIRDDFLQGLEIHDDAELGDWLSSAGITRDDFERVIRDFAAVVAVESYYSQEIAPRIDLHRRLVNARMERLSALG